MNEPTHDHQPPTLREVLDRGEDLARHISMWPFVEELARIDIMPPKACREDLIRLLDAWPRFPGSAARSDEMRIQRLWALEILDNPDLMPRVLAALPPEAADELRRHVYEERHQHPLEIGFPVDDEGEPIDWVCHNCGASHEPGEAEAVNIRNQPHGGDLPYSLNYCRSCIGMAAAATSELDAIS